MQIVNGYVCQTCCDVALAKKGKDPAHPNADPSKAGKADKPGQPGSSSPTGSADQTQGVQSSNAARPAVTFGGALAWVNGVDSTAQPTQPPSPTQYSGGLVNLSV